MSTDQSANGEVNRRRSLGIEIGREIERLCDQFETVWNSGHRPFIGTYLCGLGTGPRPLLEKLLELELDLRLKIGAPAPWGVPLAVSDESTLSTRCSVQRNGYRRRRLTKGEYARWATRPMGKRFRIEKKPPIGAGGLGVVYAGRDLELNREVAIKQILPEHADNASFRARFIQEAEITGSLEHPNIIPIYGVGYEDAGRPFYAMRFITGESRLEDKVRELNRKLHGQHERPSSGKVLGGRLLERFLRNRSMDVDARHCEMA